MTRPDADVSFSITREPPGSTPLNPAAKRWQFPPCSRRDFLARCSYAATAAFLPAGLRAAGFAAALDPQGARLHAEDFHLHPHYREPLPLEPTLLKTKAGSDEFVSEKYAEEIAAILERWSAGLRASTPDLQAIAGSLAPDFVGCSFNPARTRALRSRPWLQIWRNEFSAPALSGEKVLAGLAKVSGGFARIETAEFQVTSIDASVAGRLQTRVRYELVGSERSSYREQRVGEWELTWIKTSAGDYLLKEWRALGETQSAAASAAFVDIAPAMFANAPSYSSQLQHGADYWRTVLDGACGIDVYGHNGVAVGDIDGDGLDDLYVCQPAGLPNRLYRNRGDGTFEDVTDSSGTGILDNTSCALFADVDNDGRQDLIVVRNGGPLLLLNFGNGKFRPKRDAFQFATPPQGSFTGAAVADYDRDGWLDVYFCLYLYYQGTGQYRYPSPYFDAANGPPNFLLHNNRDGTFRDVTAESGLNRNNTRYSFCCGWNDYNQDGWPDLYVVNDFGRKNLYRNNGDGTFTDVAPETGTEDLGAGMSVCWLDYDRDGADDLYVADMWTAAGLRISGQDIFQKTAPEAVRALYRKHAMGNSLLRNNGTGKFQDAAGAGVAMGRWSWSSDAWDFDHDGLPDLYIANGMISGPSREDLNSFFWRQVVAKSPVLAKAAPEYEQGWTALNELVRSDSTWSGYERNVFYANNGDGTFSDVSGALELDFLEDGRTFALADIDGDGRLEAFLKNRNGPQLRLLKNVIRDLPPSISFRLTGSKSNRDAIGAVITVETEKGTQMRTLQAGSGFLAQHTKEMFFGLGEAKGPVKASIRWPSGLVQELHDLPINHRVWVEEGSEPRRVEAFRAGAPPKIASSEKHRPERLPEQFETWLLAPVLAPDFSLPDLDGKTHSLSGLRGSPVLLKFWAGDSARCREELGLCNRGYRRWAEQGLRVLSVNVDGASAAGKAQALARELRLSFPVLRGSEDVAAIYNLLYRYLFDRHRDLSLPTSFLIDPAGEIVKIHHGPLRVESLEQDFLHLPRTAIERVAKALPFAGLTESVDFQRNYLSLASVFFQRGYMDPAESGFRAAIRDDPASAEAFYGLGSVYLKQDKIAEARDSFERASSAKAGYPETMPNVWNNLGLLATREGQTDHAIECFQKALQFNPDHLIALENLGNAYRQQKRWDEARQALQHALEVNPEDATANYSLAMVFAQTDDSQQAYDYFQHALKSRPDYPEALNNLGVLYLRTQRRDDAVASFEECIRVAPEFDQSYLNLARVYALEGTPEKARNILGELLKLHPGHALASQMLEQLSK